MIEPYFLPLAESAILDGVVRAHAEGSLCHSPGWLALVAELTGAEAGYLLLGEPTAPRALVPLCLKVGPLGVLANSLPYFGSHGGILATDPQAFAEIADRLPCVLRDMGVGLANLIEPLFARDRAAYDSLGAVMADRRLAQVKDIRGLADTQALLSSVGGLVRNNLTRKSWRTGISVQRDERPEAIERLWRLHHAEMSTKPNGKPKTMSFFQAIARRFEIGRQWRIYWGYIDSRPVAGLLLLYHENMVEYITPVFDTEYRSAQPLTAVLFEAMREAAAEGYAWFNFGGTWPSQDGVRAFKDSWVVSSWEYRYHILDLGALGDFRAAPREALARDYNGFYAFPY